MTPTSSAKGMLESVFVDTGYILALVNENDQFMPVFDDTHLYIFAIGGHYDSLSA